MATSVTHGPASDVRDVFEQDRAALLALLGELSSDDWGRMTAAKPWTVRHVAAHLLGDDVNRLSRMRDGHSAAGPESGASLAVFLDRINEQWVRACERISAPVLVSLLETTSAEVLGLWRRADLEASGEAVSWAGPGPAPVWLDCAREFTEYWVHQQQIREATGREQPPRPDTLHAVLDTFLRAVPFTLDQHHSGPQDDDAVSVTVPGPAGGVWAWRRSKGSWQWTPPGEPANRRTELVIDADTLWRLCVRMVEPEVAQERVTVRGDEGLARSLLNIVSIIRS